jgi:hypothetical protein
MQKKYQVFVSSTFRDLADERQDTIRNILDLGHIPAGMELFPAADTEQFQYIKKVIDECDYYILIMGGRYGSLDAGGVSFTEREYDYAVETGKVVLAFPHGDLASIPVGKSDLEARMRDNLSSFRSKVMTGRLVREWIRGDTAASEDLLSQINKLRIETENLRKENSQLKSSLVPKIDDLATGSEIAPLRFSYTYRYSGRSETRNRTIELTWDEIFIAIGGNIAVPRSTGLIGHYLSKYVYENKNYSEHMKLFETDFPIVKNQLAALGLIKAYIGNTVKDGGLHEFMQLTPAGHKKLLEQTTVKSET